MLMSFASYEALVLVPLAFVLAQVTLLFLAQVNLLSFVSEEGDALEDEVLEEDDLVDEHSTGAFGNMTPSTPSNTAPQNVRT